MLRTFLLSLVIITLLSAACKGGRNPQQAADTGADRCFVLREGQDVAWVRLHLNGNVVSGTFMNLPYEKDRAVGSLSGTLTGDRITATWKYSQEGMEQELPVIFQLAGDALLRQEWLYDPATGAAKLDPNGKFSYRYTAANCAEMPEK